MSVTFTNTNAPAIGWNSIKCNLTGKYLIACKSGRGVYTSSSYGVNWNITSLATNNSWTSVTSDSTGRYLAALSTSGNLKGYSISSSYGVNWNSTLIATVGSSSNQSIVINSTGQYLVVGLNNYTYISSNFGTSFYQTSLNKGDGAYTIDSTGTYITYVENNNNIVYYSINRGASFVEANSGTFGQSGSSAASLDGKYVYGLNGNSLVRSTSYGANWTLGVYLNSYFIACDYTGQNVIVIAGPFNNLYISNNYGVSFGSAVASGNTWSAITVNSDFTNLFAALSAGTIQSYVSYIAPDDPTITPAATQNITLSIVTNTASVTATSNSAGAMTYSLDGPSSSIATIT